MTSKNANKTNGLNWDVGHGKTRTEKAAIDARSGDDHILYAPARGKLSNILHFISEVYPELCLEYGSELVACLLLGNQSTAVLTPVYEATAYEVQYLLSDEYLHLSVWEKKEVQKEFRREAIKENLAKARRSTENSKKLFFDLLANYMSKESLDLVKSHKDYNEREARHDVLIRIIFETHLVGSIGSGLSIEETARKKSDMICLWVNMKRTPGMTVSDYRRQMDAWFKAHEMAKTHIADSTVDQVMAVIQKCGDKKLISEFNTRSRPKYPRTLVQAYDLLTSIEEDKEAVNEAADPPPSVDIATVLVAAVTESLSSKTNRNKNRGSGGTPAAAPVVEEIPPPVSTCWGCGRSGHRIRDCTDRSVVEARQTLRQHHPSEKRGAPATKPLSKKDARFVALLQQTLDEKLEHRGSEDTKVPANSIFSIIMTATKEDPEFDLNNDWLLDTQGGMCVVNNLDLLVNVHRCAPVSLCGIDARAAPLIVEATGEFHGIPVGYTPHAGGNVLSFASVTDATNLQIEFHRDADERAGAFSVIVRSTGQVYWFRRRLMRSGKRSAHYVYRASNNQEPSRIMVATVAGNLANLTKAQRSQVNEAMDMQARCGYPPIETMIATLPHMTNHTVSAADARLAKEVHGDASALAGTAKSTRAPAASRLNNSEVKVDKQQRALLDIFFVGGLAFLLVLFRPLNFAAAYFLGLTKAKSVESVAKGIWYALALAYKRGFTVSAIDVDGESSIGAMKDELAVKHGIAVETKASGDHVGPIERLIQTVKSRFRAQKEKLPMRLNRILVIFGVLYAVYTLGFYPSKASPNNVPPRESWSGYRCNAKVDLPYQYAQYGYYVTSDGTSNPRTHPALMLQPIGQPTGNMKVWDLHTQRILVRRDFKALPMPTNVIAHLNALADRDGFTADNDLGLSAIAAEDEWLPEEARVIPPSLTVHGRPDTVLPPALASAAADAGVELDSDGFSTLKDDENLPQVRRSARLQSTLPALAPPIVPDSAPPTGTMAAEYGAAPRFTTRSTSGLPALVYDPDDPRLFLCKSIPSSPRYCKENCTRDDSGMTLNSRFTSR